MTNISTRVHVKATPKTTFDYLVAFETYPEFVKPVREVRRDPERHRRVEFSWLVAGTEHTHSIDVELDRANNTLHWRSVGDGPDHAGTVEITEIKSERSALTVNAELNPSGAVDKIGTATGVIRGRLEHHLHEFASYVETQTGRRPTKETEGYRAPSEKLFDAVFPTDETTRGR